MQFALTLLADAELDPALKSEAESPFRRAARVMAKLATAPREHACRRIRILIGGVARGLSGLRSGQEFPMSAAASVRDRIMICPQPPRRRLRAAQRLHASHLRGRCRISPPRPRRKLAFVVDIGRATEVVHAVLAGMNYRNLDEEPSLKGLNTTTEVLARLIFDRIGAAIRRDELRPGGRAVHSIRVTLHESHVASAAFEGSVGGHIGGSEFRVGLSDSNYSLHCRRRIGWLVAGLVLVRAKVAVEQHVATHAEYAISRALAALEHITSRQADRRPAIADDQRRNRHLKSIELVSLEEHRTQ